MNLCVKCVHPSLSWVHFLARKGEAKISMPGGCAIGARPIDLHLKAFEALGAKIEITEDYV